MTDPVVSRAFPVVDLDGLARLAQEVAFAARRGDMIALHGDLGAGKTTFARFLIEAVVPDVAEVPSPTFTLVQTYLGARFGLAHFDLYRLADPSELDELGFDEFTEQGVALVEWPERAGNRLPAARLDVRLGDCRPGDVPAGADASGLRRVELVGFGGGSGGWADRVARLADIHDFLVAGGCGAGRLAYMQGDASPRRYAVLWPSSLTSPSPLVGEGRGGGDGRTTAVGVPPPPPPPHKGEGQVKGEGEVKGEAQMQGHGGPARRRSS